MAQVIEGALNAVVEFLWGPVLLVGLLGIGLYLSAITGFWQIRNLPRAFKQCFFPRRDGIKRVGALSPYQAASVAIAGAIGTGNIGGVASAIALGGPGIVFWMWVAALLGMMTKMAEIALAVYYRDRKPDGGAWGGPTFYIEKGIGPRFKHWRIPAAIFGGGIFLQLFFSMEGYTVAESFQEAWGANTTMMSILYGVMTSIIVLGGMKGVARFASFMVPCMSIAYIAGGVVIIALNIDKLPSVIALIFEHAFTPMAAIGGFAGASVIMALRIGVSRSVFSNEAGWGISPMVNASARTAHPVEQGMWGIVEVFIDTMLVCTVTCFVILITGEWTSGEAGATLTMRSFRAGLGDFGFYLVPCLLFLFSWTTSTGWSVYFQTIVEHFYRDKPDKAAFYCKIIRIIYPIPTVFFSIFIFKVGMKTDIAWLFMDITTALPIYVNVGALILLSGKFKALVKDYDGPRVLMNQEEFRLPEDDKGYESPGVLANQNELRLPEDN